MPIWLEEGVTLNDSNHNTSIQIAGGSNSTSYKDNNVDTEPVSMSLVPGFHSSMNYIKMVAAGFP